MRLENRVRGTLDQTGDMTSGIPTEDSTSGSVEMRVMVKKPGVTEDNGILETVSDENTTPSGVGE